MLEGVRGQAFARKVLTSVVNSGRLPFGLLFYGPAGTGKYTSALALAKVINCRSDGLEDCKCPSCKKIGFGCHPDVKVIEPDEQSTISVEQIRALIRAFDYRLNEGKRKVCVIRRAHCLNQHSANALLKVLEEPKGDASIILTSSNPSNLLDTIKSRCQRVRFSFLGDDDLVEIGSNIGVAVSEVEVQMMSGSFRPDLVMDELTLTKYLWEGTHPVHDIKMGMDKLRGELLCLAVIFGVMLKGRLHSFRGVSIVRANAEKLSKLLDHTDTAVRYLDAGVRPVLALKYFENRVREVVK